MRSSTGILPVHGNMENRLEAHSTILMRSEIACHPESQKNASRKLPGRVSQKWFFGLD
ncbi:MAG: hypothetical protein VYC82_06355 [Verrucomicrobiota bacterium]|nr:hypothetical protein [Verrucomicrobiota bacterium]